MISYTANRQEDGESYRLARLDRISALIPFTVKALHDHKGILFVNWDSEPCVTELMQVEQAWQTECECSVNHYINDVWLLGDSYGHNPFTVPRYSLLASSARQEVENMRADKVKALLAQLELQE